MKLLSSTLFLLFAMSLSAQGINLGIYSSVNYNYRYLGSFEETDFGEKFELNKALDEGKINLGIGLLANYAISEKWSLLFNVNYANRGYIAPDAEFRYPNQHDGNGGVISIDHLNKEYNILALTSSISIARALWYSDKHKISIQVGPHVSWIWKQYREIQRFYSSTNEWEVEQEPSNYKRYVLGISSGAMYEYSFGNRFNLLFGLSHNISNNTLHSRPFKEHLWTISGISGISISL